MSAHFFDIVNGFFKIDAVVHVDRPNGVRPVAVGSNAFTINLAEIINAAHQRSWVFESLLLNDPDLPLVVRTLKREVRAIRGCLGIYRR